MGISKFTQEIKSEIADRYKKGENVTLLCREYGISRSYLYKIVKLKRKHRNPYQKTVYTLWDIELMKRELAVLKTENEIFRKSGCGLSDSNDKKIAAVEKLKEEYSIHTICKTLGLLKSTYYHRIMRAPEKKWYEIRNEMLRPKILEIFNDSKERFGAPKIRIKLKEEGFVVSVESVTKLMNEMGLVCKQNCIKKYTPTKNYYVYSLNILNRNFNPDKPNRYWASDITYMPTNEGCCYICVVLELFSRKVIAYNVSDRNDTDLVLTTFNKAFFDRGNPENLIFHSDQGTQYTSSRFQYTLWTNNVRQSLSKPGTPRDNAVAERFFKSIKYECLKHKTYRNIEELRVSVEEYMNYYNEMRPMKTRKYLTPNEFEQRYFEKIAG